MKNENGFTILEIMLSITIMLIILASSFSLMEGTLKMWLLGTEKIALHQEARYIMGVISREIRSSLGIQIVDDNLYILLKNSNSSVINSVKYNKKGNLLVRNAAVVSRADKIETMYQRWLEDPESFSHTGSNTISRKVLQFNTTLDKDLIHLELVLFAPDGYTYSLKTKSFVRGVPVNDKY